MPKFTKSERQYVKGMVHNLSLQRFTDQDIVDYLHSEKKIDITRSMITKIRNQTEQEAEKWYSELTQLSFKSIAIYKERVDSLLSYQKRLHKIINFYMQDGQILYSDTIIRAIAELHRIEISLHNLMKELPEFNVSSANEGKTKVYGGCTCSTNTSSDRITHSKCRYCLTSWCYATFNQDWCPNPECSHGIKGHHFAPYDEHNTWVQCNGCKQWFKKQEILEAHRYECPFPGCEPLVHQDQVIPKRTEPTIEMEPVVSSSPVEEPIEEEPETEAERYWREHPVRRRVV